MKNSVSINPFSEDVFSLGLLLLKVILLVEDDELARMKSDILKIENSKSRMEYIDRLMFHLGYTQQDKISNLISNCLSPNSNERPSFTM
jgi:hypothetical protein